MKNNRILNETIVIMVVSLAGILLFPQLKAIFVLLPVVYLLVEGRVRHRTWADLGFKPRSFWADVRANLFWFVLAGVISQPFWFFLQRAVSPEITDHIVERLPFPPTAGGLFVYAIPLAVALIGEELTHRTLIQGRLTPFIGVPFAILIASLVFGVSHYSPGSFSIVVMDIGGIFVDSILLGILYARSNNLLISWTAHLLGDVLGLLLIISIT